MSDDDAATGLCQRMEDAGCASNMLLDSENTNLHKLAWAVTEAQVHRWQSALADACAMQSPIALTYMSDGWGSTRQSTTPSRPPTHHSAFLVASGASSSPRRPC